MYLTPHYIKNKKEPSQPAAEWLKTVKEFGP